MRLTNNLRLPDAVVRAVMNDEYTRGAADFSVTQLLEPPKKVQLCARHDDELSEDVSMKLPALVGQFGHTLFHEAAKVDALPGVLAEQRFYIKRDMPSGRIVTISGQMDHVLVAELDGENELTDYKFPGITSLHMKLRYGMEEWIEQVNLYALILRENGIPIPRARIIATGLGWLASQAERDNSYPQTQTLSIPVELWNDNKVENFLFARLMAHVEAEATEEEGLPDCTAAERWVSKASYRIMKPGRKTAVRKVDTKAEAEIILNGNEGWWIDESPGISKRCGRYCAAGRAGLCEQWKAEQATLVDAGTPISSEAEEPALS